MPAVAPWHRGTVAPAHATSTTASHHFPELAAVPACAPFLALRSTGRLAPELQEPQGRAQPHGSQPRLQGVLASVACGRLRYAAFTGRPVAAGRSLLLPWSVRPGDPPGASSQAVPRRMAQIMLPISAVLVATVTSHRLRSRSYIEMPIRKMLPKKSSR